MKTICTAAAVAAALATATPAAASDLHSLIQEIASSVGVPTDIAHAVIYVESSYRCGLVHPRTKASGIMQVLPATARSVGVHGSLTDCRMGLLAGMRYLKIALAKGGHGCEGVSLYERGIYARPQCTAYGRKVMSRVQHHRHRER